MSLYNIMNGINQATLYVLPMLNKHPDAYPRFRDCFIGTTKENFKKLDQFDIPIKEQDTSKDVISVYTRIGGNNREHYKKEIDTLQKIKEYIKDFDDTFDTTFATFEFNVPTKWKKDFDLICNDKLIHVSKQYKKQLIKVYPNLKNEFNTLFNHKRSNIN